MDTQAQVDDATYRRILNFLYDEAELFDQHAYGRWLERVTPDIRYRMPGRGFHEGQAPAAAFLNGYFDDDYATLATRIDLWSRPATTTAESPPTVTRHFVTNIRAYDGEQPGSYRVTSHVLVFRRISSPAGATTGCARRAGCCAWRRATSRWTKWSCRART
jgi:3-phenylpropionate/cinnamic acid dioxygenase small subunit